MSDVILLENPRRRRRRGRRRASGRRRSYRRKRRNPVAFDVNPRRRRRRRRRYASRRRANPFVRHRRRGRRLHRRRRNPSILRSFGGFGFRSLVADLKGGAMMWVGKIGANTLVEGFNKFFPKGWQFIYQALGKNYGLAFGTQTLLSAYVAQPLLRIARVPASFRSAWKAVNVYRAVDFMLQPIESKIGDMRSKAGLSDYEIGDYEIGADGDAEEVLELAAAASSPMPQAEFYGNEYSGDPTGALQY